jgi:hypothetical protein
MAKRRCISIGRVLDRIHSCVRNDITRSLDGRAWWLISFILVLANGAWYLLGPDHCAGLGFPLDDPWIHQTYARNLVRTGRLVYTAGQASAGSTSPLWTLLLSLGRFVGLGPLPSAYGLGILGWLLLARISVVLTRRLFPRERDMAPLVGLACLLEWHLAWAAFSGMEITLFASLSLLLVERYIARARPIWIGVFGGLLIWTRPEGILLVGLIIGTFVMEGLWSRRRPTNQWRDLLGIGMGVVACVLPYAALNLRLWGQPLPTTYYAKYAEYQNLLSRSIWERLLEVTWPPLVGAQVLLLPGFAWQALVGLWQMFVAISQSLAADAKRVPRREVRATVDVVQGADPSPSAFAKVLPIVWWMVFHLVYALRLPVGYHHGRYLMPTIPVVLMYGIVGTARWVRRSRDKGELFVARVLKRTLVVSACCLFVVFLILGGRTYAYDVCIIQGEMVDVALWLRVNTPPGALVATHDIGAIGYFSERPLLDLAGLITPEVIPIVRDEEQLLAYLVEQKAQYLVTFPDWYPTMVKDDRLTLVYQTDCTITREKLGDNMAVYRISR